MCAGITITDKASCAQPRPAAAHRKAAAAAEPLRILSEPQEGPPGRQGRPLEAPL